jgi:hypothetical protein
MLINDVTLKKFEKKSLVSIAMLFGPYDILKYFQIIRNVKKRQNRIFCVL